MKIINNLILKYNCKTPEDYKNAFKEIIQEITLLGLSRQNFFDKAAFYGGSALRIAYQIDRFSEDLDFTLLKSDHNFHIEEYIKGLEDEFLAFGLKLKVEKKIKNKKTPIESAFIKGNTLEHILMIKELDIGINKNDTIKVKLEIDIEPPKPSGETEVLFATRPLPFSYRILKKPSLFSGKIHALLCRSYVDKRVKGRDLYDFIWYIDKEIKPDLTYLEAKMRQTKHWDKKEKINSENLKKLLKNKFDEIDFNQAKKDIAPFIKDNFELKVWSKDFFKSLVEKI